jgi:hypothetical protein
MFACTVVRILFQLIAEYVIVKGSNAPCHPALRVGQCVNDCPSAAQVTLAAWPELSKPFCERRTPMHETEGARWCMRPTVSNRTAVWSDGSTVHINQDAQAKPITRAEKALKLIDSAGSAPAETRETVRIPDTLPGRSLRKPCVRRIRLPHPVPHRYPKRVDALIHQGAKVTLRHPLSPMLTQLPVALTRPQNAAKGVMVHCRLRRRLPLKLVEQTGRHPWLQHQPATEIHSTEFGCQPCMPVFATTDVLRCQWLVGRQATATLQLEQLQPPQSRRAVASGPHRFSLDMQPTEHRDKIRDLILSYLIAIR